MIYSCNKSEMFLYRHIQKIADWNKTYIRQISEKKKNNLAKSAPPRHLNIHVPLPRNELLLYLTFGLLVPSS